MKFILSISFCALISLPNLGQSTKVSYLICPIDSLSINDIKQIKNKNLLPTNDALLLSWIDGDVWVKIEHFPKPDIQYYLNLRLNLSTDQLSDRIMDADPQNIEGIQWSKTKNATDIYQ